MSGYSGRGSGGGRGRGGGGGSGRGAFYKAKYGGGGSGQGGGRGSDIMDSAPSKHHQSSTSPSSVGVANSRQLYQVLESIDGSGYGGYKRCQENIYQFDAYDNANQRGAGIAPFPYTLEFVYVQGDPYAAPSRFSVCVRGCQRIDSLC